MLIIRLVKGLSVSMISSLESSGAWLLEFSKSRMLMRTVTAAKRAYQRNRGEDLNSPDGTPLGGYDRNAVQNATVREMVSLMRRKAFLSLQHRLSECLQNVLGDSVHELRDASVQKMILDMDNQGRMSAELHASAIFPDIFGPLSKVDIDRFFGGKRFKVSVRRNVKFRPPARLWRRRWTSQFQQLPFRSTLGKHLAIVD